MPTPPGKCWRTWSAGRSWCAPKVITADEAAIGDHQAGPIAGAPRRLRCIPPGAGLSAIHRDHTGRYLRRLVTECPFGTLADLRREALERWLALRAGDGMGAKTRNLYRGAVVAFCNWCVEASRLVLNPFDPVAKANEKADLRRQRRSMMEPELVKLLTVARERPLIEALTVRKGPRKGERYADVRPEVRERLEWLGRERALIYKTLVLTGLRKGELASLTVAHLHLDEAVPFAALDAADEKNREGNAIALRDDLAADLRDWLDAKLRRLQEEALATGAPIPARLPADTPLFTVPKPLVRILNRDLRLAGIAKRDDRGRTLDVHALRTTFGTLLSKGGVAPRTAQAAMRHSDIKLTMGVYTDPKLLDVRGALDALPMLPLRGDQAEGAALQATGTDGEAGRKFVPGFVPTSGNPTPSGSFPVKTCSSGPAYQTAGTLTAKSCPVNTKGPLSSPDSEPGKSGRLDSNQRPYGPEPYALAKLSYAPEMTRPPGGPTMGSS